MSPLVMQPARDRRGAPAWLAAGALLVFLFGALAILAQAAGPHLTRNWYAVPAESRGPVLPVGALVYAPYVDAHDLRVGDTVVYRRPEQPDILLFHRVEELRQAPSFRATGVVATMRDAAGDDPPFIIQFGGDVQRVSWYEPHLGGALLALRRLGGDALFIVVALALNASWMWHLVRRIRSRHMAAAPHHPAYGGPSQPRSTLV